MGSPPIPYLAFATGVAVESESWMTSGLEVSHGVNLDSSGLGTDGPQGETKPLEDPWEA
jgi:hypothetical protein